MDDKYAPIRAAIITLSDKGYKREREDKSGATIRDFIGRLGGSVVSYEIIPDEADSLRERLIHLSDHDSADLILTTGGTGLSPRDITPETTISISDKIVPGIAEAMRMKSLEITPHAMLSRAVAAIRKSTLIINLPGSPKAVRECLEVISPILSHAIEKIKGDPSDCGS